MNRVNKVTSVFIITLFVAMLAVPFLNAAECDMECCTVQMPMDCGMEMDADSCCPSISECSDAVFIPIVTAPILNVNVEKDITAEYMSSMDETPNYDITFSVQPNYIKIDTPAPPGFQTPLLV
jgi:hypothetical protein